MGGSLFAFSPLLETVNHAPWSPTMMPMGRGIGASHLGLGLIFVLVVEELIPTQHEPALLPALHDASLLLQPARLQHGAQPAGAGRPPGAPALLPHHQALGAGWKSSTHSEHEGWQALVSPCPTLASQPPSNHCYGSFSQQGVTMLGPPPPQVARGKGWGALTL